MEEMLNYLPVKKGRFFLNLRQQLSKRNISFEETKEGNTIVIRIAAPKKASLKTLGY